MGAGREDSEIRSFLRVDCGLPESAEASSLTILRINHCREVVLVAHLPLLASVSALHVYNFFHESLMRVQEDRALEEEAVNHVRETLKRSEEAQPTSPDVNMMEEGRNTNDLIEPEGESQNL